MRIIKVGSESPVLVNSCLVDDGLVLVDEDKIDDKEVVVFAAQKDIPVRTDLPRDHPLYGRRILKVVPAGMPDLEIDANGQIKEVVIEVPGIKEVEISEEMRSRMEEFAKLEEGVLILKERPSLISKDEIIGLVLEDDVIDG
jgi:hypothetical protein